MRAKTLTITQLGEKKACYGALKVFKRLFGKSVRVTQKAMISYAKARKGESKEDFGWAAEKFDLIGKGAIAHDYSLNSIQCPLCAATPIEMAKAFARAYNKVK